MSKPGVGGRLWGDQMVSHSLPQADRLQSINTTWAEGPAGITVEERKNIKQVPEEMKPPSDLEAGLTQIYLKLVQTGENTERTPL